eukprot:EG_transcript_19973
MPANPTMRQKHAKRKYHKVLVEHRRQNPLTPEEEEERREQKQQRKLQDRQKQREARSKIQEQTCELCNIVVDDWETHHKGALHRHSRELLQPPYVQLLYKKKEKKLERAERKRKAKLLAEASRNEVTEAMKAEQPRDEADPLARKAEKAKAKAAKKAARRALQAQGPAASPAAAPAEAAEPPAADPWRSNRRIQHGHLQTMCNICKRWVNHTDLRSHNNGADHRAKLNALSPEDRDSFFTTRINEKKAKLNRLAERAKKVVEPKTKYLNFQNWAKDIAAGKRV